MPVSVNQFIANTLGLADPVGRIADNGRVSSNGRVNVSGRPIRFSYNFDGVDDRGQLPFRAINPEGDLNIKFKTGVIPALATSRAIVGQSQTNTTASREFLLFVSSTGDLGLQFGGVAATISPTITIANNTAYEVSLIGTALTIKVNGVVVASNSFTRGTAREPLAVTTIGAGGSGVSTYSFFLQGQLLDVSINGVLYPMSDRNQSIQLPNPSGLGTELITPSVLTNPASVGNQWTYLGAGRWQYVGDGSANVLQFIATASQPVAGYLEFEVESISGTMRCFSNTLNVGTNQSDPVFSTTGVKRWFILNKDLGAANSAFCFQRQDNGVAASCIIKNISFKPLWVANATELVANGDFASGTTGWSQLSSAVLTVNAGQGSISYAAAQNSRVERGVVLEANTYYVVSADVVSITGVTSARLTLIRGAAGSYATLGQADLTAAGKVNFVILSPATDAIISLRTGGTVNSGTIVWDNVSVRKLDSVCNPLQLVNTTSDRWQEVAQ